MTCTHFVGFKDDRYWWAVKIFGPPHFIHRRWDLRGQREIAEGDIVVFATGTDKDIPSRKSGDDYSEETE